MLVGAKVTVFELMPLNCRDSIACYYWDFAR